jgi:putative oxidoreductase
MARPAYRDRVLSPDPGPGAGPASLPWARAAHALLRAGVGLLFMQHGLQKLFGFFGGHPVPLASQLGVASILELVGGALIVVGLLVRPVGAILALEMLTATVMVHLPRGGTPLQNGAELPLLYALVFIFLAANGAGPCSADAALARSERRILVE